MDSFKVVLLGEGCVGKTSVVLRFVEDKFNSKHMSTLQASFLTKKVTVADNQNVQLNIWDTAGQERFHALGPVYYRGAHGAILVFDITERNSFEQVKNWVKELRRMLGTEITISIAGNKSDLDQKRTVPQDEAITYANNVGANYIETSAKENENIEDLFLQLTEQIVKSELEKRANAKANNDNRNRSTYRLTLDDNSTSGASDEGRPAASKSSCCGNA